jgi:membrane-associated PAP2 superfamily phosphatase
MTLSLCVILTLIVFAFDLDIGVSSMFFSDQGWHLKKTVPWIWLYEYGTLPALLMGIASLVYVIAGLFVKRLATGRMKALLILLTLMIGPGLLVNSVFKDRWGRPRPRQIEQFDGKWEYREAFEPGIPGKGNSFPCGHASMGFYFLVLYYVYRDRRKITRISIASSALAFGSLIGAARIVQGGHYLSDVIWSAGMTNITAAALFYLLIDRQQTSDDQVDASEINRSKPVKYAKAGLWTLGIAALVWIFVFTKPAYKEYRYRANDTENHKFIDISVIDEIGDIDIEFTEISGPVNVHTTISAFGFPEHKFISTFTERADSDTLYITYSLAAEGLFTKIGSHTKIEIASDYPVAIDAMSRNGDITLTGGDSALVSRTLSAPHGSVEYR